MQKRCRFQWTSNFPTKVIPPSKCGTVISFSYYYFLNYFKTKTQILREVNGGKGTDIEFLLTLPCSNDDLALSFISHVTEFARHFTVEKQGHEDANLSSTPKAGFCEERGAVPVHDDDRCVAGRAGGCVSIGERVRVCVWWTPFCDHDVSPNDHARAVCPLACRSDAVFDLWLKRFACKVIFHQSLLQQKDADFTP